MKRFLLLAALSVFLLGSTSSAFAVQITNWDYNIQYGFSAFTDGDPGATTYKVTGSVPNTDFPGYVAGSSDYWTTLSWGEPATSSGQSSIVVNPYSNTGTTPLDTTTLGPKLTHNNNIIKSDTGVLDTATLSSYLSLTPAGYPEFPGFNTGFDVEFKETPNVGGPVNDVFLITGLSDFTEAFVWDGYLYKVEFFIAGLIELSDEDKALFGLSPEDDAVGFSTVESADSNFQTSFKISSRVVPEPATMVIFGVGLLCLAGVSRKKNTI